MMRSLSFLVFILMGITIGFAQITTEEITIQNQAIQLPGTLTYSSEKSPLIIWVHGSGGVDRDGNQPQYIKQFRNAVNKKNIAFFSYDKRTANPQNSAFLKDGVFFNDFVFDVEEVVNRFKNDTRFSSITLAGHSQGSLIAMMALKNVNKYISIAGAGETIDKILIKQLNAQSPEYGKIAKAHFKELKETGGIREVNPNLMAIFAKPNQEFWSSWVAIDPITEIKKVTIPTLIVNGDKDIQVGIENASNLKTAKPNATFVIIQNMNHILKDIQKEEDNIKSYSAPAFPVSKKLIETIVSFIKKTP
jgi:pimeloyl-ACP methyl ester carboxylesterase|tara:strand:+ start:1606 stop:2520 length:915 start_codon:yes stop_codon:yes gene_type:complete